MDQPGARAAHHAQGADLSLVAAALGACRDEILSRWLAAAEQQPFHAGRPGGAVADHVPRLFDAMVDLLRHNAPRSVDPGAPLEDPRLLDGAQSHARARLEQGLTTADVVLEFRLLRQEIGRALRRYVPESSPNADVAAAELLVHDTLDSAVFLAVSVIGVHEAERRAQAAAAERAREEAEAAVQLRDRVLTALSHDLRTPLTAINGYAQLLSRQASRIAAVDASLAAELEKGLTAIVTAARRLARWSDEMTDVARLQVGQTLPLNPQPVDLVALVRRVVQEQQAIAPDNTVHVQTSVPELVGHWDGPRLERLLHNLVGNAIKYSTGTCADLHTDSADITVAVAAAPAMGERPTSGQPRGSPAVDTPAAGEEPAAWAEITVRDTGIGIPAADLPSIFEPFTRGSNTQSITGTGVGLAVARRIVEEHGGSIHIASQEGAGTTVTVRLPLGPTPDEDR